jgi:hypothetical protein
MTTLRFIDPVDPEVRRVFTELAEKLRTKQISVRALAKLVAHPMANNLLLTVAEKWPEDVVPPNPLDLFRRDHVPWVELQQYADPVERKTMADEPCRAICEHLATYTICRGYMQTFLVPDHLQPLPVTPAAHHPLELRRLDDVEPHIGHISPGWALGHSGRDDQ